jgi:hypothetical protein
MAHSKSRKAIAMPSTRKVVGVKGQVAPTSIPAHGARRPIPCSDPVTSRERPHRPPLLKPVPLNLPRSQQRKIDSPEVSVPTPVRAHRLQYHLQEIQYDPAITTYLVDGFLHGFPIGHTAVVGENFGKNSPNVYSNEEAVAEKLEKEIRAGRIQGPFDTPPFSPFTISPLNIRPKKTPNKYRLLHNLSHPYDGTSVNDNIPADSKTVHYATVCDAIFKLLLLPFNCYTAKTDIADAFRIIPVQPADYPKLGMCFRNKFYYDKALPQGCGSSCKIFETLSTALHAILEARAPEVKCVHMLDDFFIMSADYATCASHLQILLDLCEDIGIPIAPEKTTKPSTNTTFLGVELDTTARIARLPIDKLTQYSADIREVLAHNKIQKRDLESLIGKLSFAACVVPARPFLRRLIDLLSTVTKPYYFIRLTHSTKQDLSTWLQFLTCYNGVTYFRALNIADSEAIHMVSDASKLGFGACFGSKWLQAAYPATWYKYHITFLELYPIFVLINIFGCLMKNSNILFHCDNSAVTAILNKQSSKDKSVMAIVRPLVLLLIKLNIRLTSKHIPGALNILPDRISRFQVTPTLLREYGMEPLPTTIPSRLLPENYTVN